MESVNRRVTRSMTTPRKPHSDQSVNTDHLKTPMRLANKFPVSRSARKPRTAAKVKEEVLEDLVEQEDDYSPQSIAARSEEDESSALDDISSKTIASPITSSPPRNASLLKRVDTEAISRVADSSEVSGAKSGKSNYAWMLVLLVLLAVTAVVLSPKMLRQTYFSGDDGVVAPSSSADIPESVYENVVVPLDEASAAETVESIPVETVESIPAETVESFPVETVESIPAETVESIPDETVESVPAETVESVPVETVESIPVETVESIPAETVESVPAETVESVPAETVESIPAETVESIPVETVESIPAETVESVPAETVESIPAETVESIPVETVESIPAETSSNSISESKVDVKSTKPHHLPVHLMRNKKHTSLESNDRTTITSTANDKADSATVVSDSRTMHTDESPLSNVEEVKLKGESSSIAADATPPIKTELDANPVSSETTASDTSRGASAHINAARAMRNNILRDATLEKLRNRGAASLRDRASASTSIGDASGSETANTVPPAASRRPGSVKCARDPVTNKLVCAPK